MEEKTLSEKRNIKFNDLIHSYYFGNDAIIKDIKGIFSKGRFWRSNILIEDQYGLLEVYLDALFLKDKDLLIAVRLIDKITDSKIDEKRF